jgi:hypothetical protein
VELYLHSRNTPSRRGAQLKHRDNFTFYLYSAQCSQSGADMTGELTPCIPTPVWMCVTGIIISLAFLFVLATPPPRQTPSAQSQDRYLNPLIHQRGSRGIVQSDLFQFVTRVAFAIYIVLVETSSVQVTRTTLVSEVLRSARRDCDCVEMALIRKWHIVSCHLCGMLTVLNWGTLCLIWLLEMAPATFVM